MIATWKAPAWKLPRWKVLMKERGRAHAPAPACVAQAGYPSLRRLLAFAVRWVLIGSITWVACLVLSTLFAPVVPLAVMLGFAVVYVADLRRLARGG